MKLSTTPEATVTAPPNYADFYKAVGPSVNNTPVDRATFLANRGNYNSATSGTILGTPITSRFDSFRYNNGIGAGAGTGTGMSIGTGRSIGTGAGTGTGRSIGAGAGTGTVGNLGFMGLDNPPSQTAMDNRDYDAYTSATVHNNKAGNSTNLSKFLTSNNPGTNAGLINYFWNNGGEGQASIHDRMPSGGGVNFADSYLSGQTPEQFNSTNPGLSLKEQTGAGVNTGFSGGSTMSSFSAPKDSFGSAYSGSDPNQGKQPMNNSLMSGPGYATGGQIGQAPMGQAPQQVGLQAPGQQQPMNGQMLDANIQDMLQKNPQIAAQVKQAIDSAVQKGTITPEMAHTVVQLAQAALNNPALWPQLRQWAIQKGLASEQDIPQQYDQGLVVAILAASRTYDTANGNQAQVVPTQNGIPQQGQKQAFATGGQIQGQGTGTSDSIQAVSDSGQHIKVSNGEFIIPKHVVEAKGTDFFEQMIAKYSPEEQAK